MFNLWVIKKKYSSPYLLTFMGSTSGTLSLFTPPEGVTSPKVLRRG
jgi:hypothetical protein